MTPMGDQQRVILIEEQMVDHTHEIISIEDFHQMFDAPTIMNAPHPTMKWAL
jgi:hypothetical protein